MPVKDSHGNLHHKIRDCFKKLHQENKLESGKNTITEIEAEHGRIDTRHYRQCLVSDWITEGCIGIDYVRYKVCGSITLGTKLFTLNLSYL